MSSSNAADAPQPYASMIMPLACSMMAREATACCRPAASSSACWSWSASSARLEVKSTK
jgi:hypothetical protein